MLARMCAGRAARDRRKKRTAQEAAMDELEPPELRKEFNDHLRKHVNMLIQRGTSPIHPPKRGTLYVAGVVCNTVRAKHCSAPAAGVRARPALVTR